MTTLASVPRRQCRRTITLAGDVRVDWPGLRQARERAGLTQEVAALAARLHPNRLGQYERGDRDGVDVRTLARIAAVYGRTTADYLVEVEA